MNIALIVVIIVVIFVFIVILRSVRIVPQARAGVVERLGRYQRTCSAGLNLLVPFVDRMRFLIIPLTYLPHHIQFLYGTGGCL